MPSIDKVIKLNIPHCVPNTDSQPAAQSCHKKNTMETKFKVTML